MPLNNLHLFCLCLFFTLNFCPFPLDVPSPLSALTGHAFSYPTSDCCPPNCSDIIFHLPNFQTPESNTSSPFHEPSFPSIICLAKGGSSYHFLILCFLFGDFSLFFLPAPVLHTHFVVSSRAGETKEEKNGGKYPM